MQRSYDSMSNSFINKADSPVWLPFLFALIGTLGCIYTAYIAVPTSLQRTLFLPNSEEYKTADETDQQTILGAKGLKAINTRKIASLDCPPLFIFSFKKNDLEPLLKGRTQKISQLRDWLTQYPDETMIVGGHSSSKGLKEPNLILSYRRAQAVHHLFVASGVPEHQLSTQAFGEEKPMAGIPSSSERNRRVSIHLKGRDECQHDAINQ